jgi:hypothetical protein
MNLLDVKKASAIIQPNHSILVYSPPKFGKTRLIGTAAQLEEIENIYWFDNENGIETLLHMGLTDEQLSKITLFRMTDTREEPISIETLLRAFSSKVPVNICEMHGRIDCAECTKARRPFTSWCLSQCTHNDLVVIDSGSQLGDSALAAACLGKPVTFKPTFDEYGMAGKWLGDICTVIQQCRNTNFVVATHEIGLEDDEGKDKIYPLMGTKNFSRKVAKYFGTVVYMHKKLGKHAAASGSLFRSDVMTGSRLNIALEKATDASMRDILVTGGILKPAAGAKAQEAEAPAAVSASPVATKPLSLAEKLALSKSKK